MKFTIKCSQEKDLQVYLDAIWKPIWVNYGKSKYEVGLKYLPQEFLDNLKNAGSKIKAINVIKNYWKDTRVSMFNRNTRIIVDWFNRFMTEESHLVVDRLEKIYQKIFPFEKITMYLTTFFSCPYNYKQKWFMVSRNANLMTLLSISTHELNHFMYYYYFEGYVKKWVYLTHNQNTLKRH
jgi:hypothetical protein